MRYLSVCSGIEAASVAWKPLGWEAVGFAEVDPFASAVLAHHYPTVKNFGDFTAIQPEDVGGYGSVDLLVGGTPCQSFSVAGKRLGMDDPRGNLAIEFLRLAHRIGVRWILFENVPGLLSSDGGRDFGTFLGLLGECGYGFSYRILDAQHFGVPQRRRRVFVVGHLGDWRRAAAVLFEPESLRGDTAPSREAGAEVAFCVTARFGSGRNDPTAETYLAHTLRADGFDASEDGTGRGTPLIAFTTQQEPKALEDGTAFTLTADSPSGGGQRQCIAFSAKDSGADAGELSPVAVPFSETADCLCAAYGTNWNGNGAATNGSLFVAVACDVYNPSVDGDIAATLTAASGGSNRSGPKVLSTNAVRRLTPTECERLQGLPDGYTAVPYRGKPAADGPRYRAIGNSFAVPCIAWLGQRIEMVESLMKERV